MRAPWRSAINAQRQNSNGVLGSGRSSEIVAGTNNTGASARTRLGAGNQCTVMVTPPISMEPSPDAGSSTMAKMPPSVSGSGDSGSSETSATSTCAGARVHERNPSSGRGAMSTKVACDCSAPILTGMRAGHSESAVRSKAMAATPPGVQTTESKRGRISRAAAMGVRNATAHDARSVKRRRLER